MNDWLDAEQHVERAHQLYEEGRWAEAESALRTALSLNPYQAEWHFNLGLTLEAAGRHREAATAFKDCYELREPERAAAVAIGVNLIRSGEPEAGLTWLDKAEGLGPAAIEADEREPEFGASDDDEQGEGDDAEAPAAGGDSLVDILIHKIGAFTDLARHDDAEAAFYLAQQHDAGRADLYAAMADDLLEQKKYERAVWCLREAVRLDPELPHVQARLAEAYAETGRSERARQLYIRELRRDPGDVTTLLDLGDLLVKMARPEEASEKYRRVLELEPDNADAHAALGELEHKFGRLDGAVASYDVVLRLDPDDSPSRRRLAEILLERRDAAAPRLGRPSDRERAQDLLAAEFARVNRLAEPPSEDDLHELGTLLLDAGLYDRAVLLHRSLAKRSPESAVALHHLSVALLQSTEPAGPHADEGIALAKKALSIDPLLVSAMHNLAVAYLRRGQWARARFWARKATATDPDDAQLRRLRLTLNARSAWLMTRSVSLLLFRVARAVYGVLGGRPRRAVRLPKSSV